MCDRLALLAILITLKVMRKYILIALLALTLATIVSGCATHSGSREFVPGKGWIYTD